MPTNFKPLSRMSGSIATSLFVLMVAITAPAQAQIENALIFSDHFDSPDAIELKTRGWNVFTPDQTVVEHVESEHADTLPRCIKLVDNNPTQRPELFAVFSRKVQQGTLSVRLRIDKLSHAPLGVQLRNDKGKLLGAVILQPNGKVSYNIGSADVMTESAWRPMQWMSLHLHWSAERQLTIKLDDQTVSEGLLLNDQDVPMQVKLTAGYGSADGREGLFDNLDVIDTTLTCMLPLPEYQGNGAWLAFAYIKKQDYLDLLPAFLEMAHHQYRVDNLYVNIGLVDEAGHLPTHPQTRALLLPFLQTIQDYETRTGKKFHVEAWINGLTTRTDLAQQQVRQQIISECQRMLDPTVDNSYVKDATRLFDGIHLDIEPTGLDPVRFSHMLTLVSDLRQVIKSSDHSQQQISIAADKLGHVNNYQWPEQFFYDMGQIADTLCVMTYNSGSKTPEEYQLWIKQQTTSVLTSVSGAHWKFDDQHPRPTRTAKVLMGIPAYKESQWHTVSAENVTNAMLGIRQAIAELSVSQPEELRNLTGTALYLHATGHGEDGYADNNTDWFNFCRFWSGTK